MADKLIITSEAQLRELCAEGAQSIRSVRVVATAEGHKQVTVVMFDGRVGVKSVPGAGPTEPLSAREWQLARVLSCALTRTLVWRDWTADRFPNFAQVAADRPVARVIVSRHGGETRGAPLAIYDADAPAGEQSHVLLARATRYFPADETNERDDPRYETDLVEPTAAEREAEFVQWVQEQADAANTHERWQRDYFRAQLAANPHWNVSAN